MTVVLSSLPPPGGSPQEVLFRRMLLQCSQRVQAPTQSDAAKDWRTDAKFHCIIEALQEKLYDLEHAGPDVRPGPDVLTQYQAAVRAITSQLQQPLLPAYCLRVSAQDRLAGAEATGAAQRSSNQAHTAHSKQQPSRSSSESQHGHQQPQQPNRNSTAAAGSAGAVAAAAGQADSAAAPKRSSTAGPNGAPSDTSNFSLTARAQQVLTTQQRLRDELTDELLEMGSELKSSTLAMQNAIRYRGKLLDETEVHLVHSAENAKAVAAKAKEQYRQGNWNLCHTCIIVLSVFVIFSVMLVAIRVSSMVGLKGN